MGADDFTGAFNGGCPRITVRVHGVLLLEGPCRKCVTSPAVMALTNGFSRWSDKRQSRALYNSLIIHSLFIYLFRDQLYFENR